MIDLTKEKPIPVSQAAELFGVHRRTIDSWLDAGLERLKMRGLVYTSLEALQRFGTQEDVRQESRKRGRSRISDSASRVAELRYG